MIDFPLYFGSKPHGAIRVNADFDLDDYKMVETTLPVLKALADRNMVAKEATP